MGNIQMVDLKGQYLKIKSEIDNAIAACIDSTSFINGPEVKNFSEALQQYLGVKKVIPCANGTDALQIAMMALDLKKGDEIIVPAFTYVATAEVIGLLGLVPVMVDVDPETYNITAERIEPAITSRTRAIVPVHLFGQCADMEPIMKLAEKHGLYVIEDTAQAIGAKYTMSDGRQLMAGTIGHIGCTSFFPSKNLGCYGDGGAIYSNSTELAERMQIIANHGQVKKYVHRYIGINSRLDSLQAAILNVKLPLLDNFSKARKEAADYYDLHLGQCDALIIPFRSPDSTHVFHQYTLQVKNNKRNELKDYLASEGIPSMIYYPVPLNDQDAFKEIGKVAGDLEVTVQLCDSVLSLPMHTELDQAQQDVIIDVIKRFFK